MVAIVNYLIPAIDSCPFSLPCVFADSRRRLFMICPQTLREPFFVLCIYLYSFFVLTTLQANSQFSQSRSNFTMILFQLNFSPTKKKSESIANNRYITYLSAMSSLRGHEKCKPLSTSSGRLSYPQIYSNTYMFSRYSPPPYHSNACSIFYRIQCPQNF